MPWMQGNSLFDTDHHDGSVSEEEDPVEEFWSSPRFEIAAICTKPTIHPRNLCYPISTTSSGLCLLGGLERTSRPDS
ncbi:hypothetical protein RSAG8_12975, partial [Rhizoctonia solani AG-8 WAC10335]